MADEPVKPGRVLAGRYRLEHRLGSGGVAAVWRAEDLKLSAPVAVKLPISDAAESEETATRFMREAKAAAALRSAHVVQILDHGVEDKQRFIVMELLHGETLRQRLKRVKSLSPGEMARIVTHVSRAMSRAHNAGIVHRDLKPDNIFLVQEEDEVAKVLDFGIAKVEASHIATDENMTRTGSMLGTPSYMSPEQALGIKAVDYRSDLWSLGVIAFECLTGKRPFASSALGDLVVQICSRPIPVPSEHAPVPDGFDAWFARATERIPEKRFQSAREMAEALRECPGGEFALDVTTPPAVPGTDEPERGGLEQVRKPHEDTFFPSDAVKTTEYAKVATPAGEPSADAAAKSTPTGQSEDAAVSQKTGVVTPVVRSSDTVAPSAAAAEGHSAGLVFLVTVGALLIGVAGGLWGVLGVRGPGNWPLPDPSFIPFLSAGPNEAGGERIDDVRRRGPSPIASAHAEANHQPNASAERHAETDEAPDATAERDAEAAHARPAKDRKRKRNKAKRAHKAAEPPLKWDWRDDTSAQEPPTPPAEDEEYSDTNPY